MESSLPQSDRPVETAAGHWVLARAGKRVLRPGGLKLTKAMLAAAKLPGARVVEFAPGLGRTAQLIVAESIASYVGVDRDVNAVSRVQRIVSSANGKVVCANAAETGLPDDSADMVAGEAMLTMQGQKSKQKIVAEAKRVLSVGGRYAIHELVLVPDDIEASKADELRKTLARVIRVNARPLTVAEWKELLTGAGFRVTEVTTAPMALLDPKGVVADEGLLGTLRIVRNLMRDKDLRARVLQMRRTFTEYKKNLAGITVVATLDEK